MNNPIWLKSIFFCVYLALMSSCLCVVVSFRTEGDWYHPARMNRGPWRSLTVDELSFHVESVEVETPLELSGSFVIAHTSIAGGMFLVNTTTQGRANGDYRITGRITLPHSTDDVTGCVPLVHDMNDEGDSFAGSFLLIQRGGGCSFSDKITNVEAIMRNNRRNAPVAVLLFGCDGSDGLACNPNPLLISPSASAAFSIPAIYAALQDGQQMKQYLLRRRASYAALSLDGVLEQPVQCTINQTLLVSSAAAATTGCVLPPLTASVVGTGALVDPNERAALVTLASALTFDSSYTNYSIFLPAWSTFASGKSDPCLNRVVGIWCTAGHVVAIDLTQDGVSGALPIGSLQSFRALQYLLLPRNSFSGPLPNDLCKLQQLTTISIDGNQFESIPDCIGDAQALQYFGAMDNQLTNLPSSFARLNQTMLIFAATQNKIAGDLTPLLSLKHLLRLEVSGNTGLTIDFNRIRSDQPIFNLMNQVRSIWLRGCSLDGYLPPSSFDGCRALQSVDLTQTNLTGSLPFFINCTRLETVLLANNRFTGGLPTSWATHLAFSLLSLDLSSNQLGGPPGSTVMDDLSRLSTLQLLNLASNNITGSVVDDVGQSLWRMMGPSLTDLHVDHNQLEGPWLEGQWILPTIRMLTVSHNRITNLPPDLWLSYLTDADFSYNSLNGTLPFGAPSLVAASVQDQPAMRSLNFVGNPALSSWPLPAWLHFQLEPVRWQLSEDSTIQCIGLTTDAALQIETDPTFVSYHGCVCTRGLFGVPPRCETLPQSVMVSPYAMPVNADHDGTDGDGNDHFADLLAWNETHATNMTWLQSNQTISVPLGTTSISHPVGYSDAWYGGDRFSAGMSTRWEMDLTALRVPLDDLSQASSDASQSQNSSCIIILGWEEMATAPLNGSHTLIDDPLQSVRVITVRLHISRALFKATSDALGVYGGSRDLLGERVARIAGSEETRIDSLPTSSDYTSTPTYLSTYGDDLARVIDPVLVEVDVLASRATVSFDSRTSSGVVFFATYSYGFQCPPDHEVATVEEFNANGAACVVPTLSAAQSVLILVFTIGGVLVVFVFVWLLWERAQKQQAHATLASRDSDGSGGSSTNSSDEADVTAELARLAPLLLRTSHRGFVKELVFEFLALVGDFVSAGLNWTVVGLALSSGTSRLTSFNVGYIFVVILSTFAIGANTVTRVFAFRAAKKMLRDEEGLKDGTVPMTNLTYTPKDDRTAIDDEPRIRTWQARTHRRLQKHSMTGLALILHSVPFIVLNLISLYRDHTTFRTAHDALVHASLLVSFLLVGAKVQEIREIPDLLTARTQARIYLLQIKQVKFEKQTDGETEMEVFVAPSVQQEIVHAVISDASTD